MGVWKHLHHKHATFSKHQSLRCSFSKLCTLTFGTLIPQSIGCKKISSILEIVACFQKWKETFKGHIKECPQTPAFTLYNCTLSNKGQGYACVYALMVVKRWCQKPPNNQLQGLFFTTHFYIGQHWYNVFLLENFSARRKQLTKQSPYQLVSFIS